MKSAQVPEPRSGMSWSSAIGLGARLESAIAEAANQLSNDAGASSHDLAIAFVSAAYGQAVERLPQLLRPVLGDCLLLGCNAGGLIGGGSEEEDEPGIALLCGRLPDAVLATARLEQATLPPLAASRESWWRLLDLAPECGASFLLLADPATIDAEACARGIDRAFPGSTVIGGLTSGMLAAGSARLVTNEEVHRSGGMLLALSGNVVIDAVLAQGCRPIGDPLFVTACDGNLISELDGRPPKELLTSLFSVLDETDRARFGDALCIGLALPGPRQTVGAGDFLIRNVLGLDPDSGALWIGARVAPNAIVQFHLRDGVSASEELEARLSASLTGPRARDPVRLRGSRQEPVRRERPRLRDAAPHGRHSGRRHVQRGRDRPGAGRDLRARLLERVRADPAEGTFTLITR
jgi:small ligand-binding sensory domain FIST